MSWKNIIFLLIGYHYTNNYLTMLSFLIYFYSLPVPAKFQIWFGYMYQMKPIACCR